MHTASGEHLAAAAPAVGLAVQVLAHPDVGPLIWELLAVKATCTFSRLCKDLHALRCAQIAEWRAQWCAAKEYPGGTAHGAAANGHLKLLRWSLMQKYFARQPGETFKWDEQLLTAAAAGGHVRVMRWLRRHGFPFGKGVCCEAAAKAAEHGQLGVLKWLRAHDYPLNEWRCTDAAVSRGHLQVLKWLRDTRKGDQ